LTQFHFLEERGHDLRELDLVGVEDVILSLGQFGLERRQFEERDARQVPSVRPRDAFDLFPGFREGDVERLFARPRSFEKELKRQRRLPHAGVAGNEIEPVPRQAASKDVIQPSDAG
jgi:hypothetical protein